MSSALATSDPTAPFETNVPARLDRLPWRRWHWAVIFALGITWILDGLEVTIVGTVGAVLTSSSTLGLSGFDVGLAGSIYIVGAVVGALFFGRLTDTMGRKRLFLVTLSVYVIATALTGASLNFLMFGFFRFVTGMGIGGEYAAINSAIDELIPARVRGHVDIAINGSWWVGTAVGAALGALFLNPAFLPINVGWRLMFLFGVILGAVVLYLRRNLPESPRWLMTHGRREEAEAAVQEIESRVRASGGGAELPPPDDRAITIRPRGPVTYREIGRTLFRDYRRRSLVGFSLMVGQAFLYNAIVFTYVLVLTTFYHISASAAALYLIAFAVGNVAGPWTIGRWFDSIGRRVMIGATYFVSGALLIVTGALFALGDLNALTQTLGWTAVFFFASAGASSAYLTVSEIFPLELRAMAIAFFYSIGTICAAVAPVFFGALISTGSVSQLFYGYLVGAALMILAGVVAFRYGVDAERRSLESVAPPLSSEGEHELRRDRAPSRFPREREQPA